MHKLTITIHNTKILQDKAEYPIFKILRCTVKRADFIVFNAKAFIEVECLEIFTNKNVHLFTFYAWNLLKRLSGSCSLFVFGVTKVVAQDFYAGVYGGWLRNEMKITDDSPQKSFGRSKRIDNGNFGIQIGCNLTDHLGLETQVQYNNILYRKSLDMANTKPGEPLYESIYWYNNHHYLRIPLLAHYQLFSSTSRFGIGVLAGPNFGFLIQQRSTFRKMDMHDPVIRNTPTVTGAPFKNMDFGVQFGLRGRAALYKSINMFLEGMMYQGFSNVADENHANSMYDDLTIVNRYINLNVGIQYSFSNSN